MPNRFCAFLLMFSFLVAGVTFVASAQIDDEDSCREACREAKDLCVTQCSEHSDPVDCAESCQNEREDCESSCD